MQKLIANSKKGGTKAKGGDEPAAETGEATAEKPSKKDKKATKLDKIVKDSQLTEEVPVDVIETLAPLVVDTKPIPLGFTVSVYVYEAGFEAKQVESLDCQDTVSELCAKVGKVYQMPTEEIVLYLGGMQITGSSNSNRTLKAVGIDEDSQLLLVLNSQMSLERQINCVTLQQVEEFCKKVNATLRNPFGAEQNVECLEWNEKGITDDDCLVIAYLLTKRTLSARRFWLHGNNIGNTGVAALAVAINQRKLDSVTDFWLDSMQNFGDEGMYALAKAFAHGAMPHLVDLHLYRSGWSDLGRMALGAALFGRSINDGLGNTW